MPWYVIYVKPKSEIKTAKTLKKMGVEVFCPVTKEVRLWSDRKKKVTVPLFRSYLFVKLSDNERSIVFDAPGVVKYLFWLGKPAIVRECEIEVIKNWLEDDNINQIKVSYLKEGDNFIITKGAFKGKKAIIQEIGRNKMKLILPNFGIFLEAGIKEISTN